VNDYSELEIKVYVTDLAAVEQRLLDAGARLKMPRTHERNLRYDAADGRLRAAHAVLRLRQDVRNRLTFKDETGALDSETAVARRRFEAEVEVSDFEAMHTILEKLGFTPFMTYEKYRTVYTLQGAEIDLDEMPYGNFVEIEGDEATIIRLLDRLGLADAPRLAPGYSALFEFVKHNLGLEFQDLTFKNFAGIHVPLSAFEAH